jgi:hypothetical protein
MSIDDSSKHKKKWGLLGVVMMGKQGRTDGDEAATQSKEPEGDNTAKQKKKQAHGRTNDNLKEKTATPSKEPERDNTAKQKKEQVHGRTNNKLMEKKGSGNGTRKGLRTIPTIPSKSMDLDLEAEEKQRKADKYRSIHFHIAKEKQIRVNFDCKTAQTKATTQNPKDIPPKLQLDPSGDWDESGDPQPITQNEPTGDGSEKGEMAVPSGDRNSSGKHRSILRIKSDASIGNGGTEGVMQKVSTGERSEDQGDWDESVNQEQVVHTRSTGDQSY